MVEKYHKFKNYTLVQQAWRTNFKNDAFPALGTIKSTIQRFNKTGSVIVDSIFKSQGDQK